MPIADSAGADVCADHGPNVATSFSDAAFHIPVCGCRASFLSKIVIQAKKEKKTSTNRSLHWLLAWINSRWKPANFLSWPAKPPVTSFVVCAMNTTPASLLERLRCSDDPSAWDRFVDLYTPLLYYWGRRAGLQEPDVADLVQDVFQILIQKLPAFTYDRHGSFRGWLHTVLLNQWRASLRRRTEQPLDLGDVVVDESDKPDSVIEKEHRDYLVTRAMQVMKNDFQTTTWQACWEHVARGRPVDEVAAELEITVRAVYLAKARVLCRLREELAGLWE